MPARLPQVPPLSTDDSTWLAGLRRGEPAAFDALFATYRPRIYGYLLRMVRAPDVAADLTQEVFLRLAQSARVLRDDTRFGAWLLTVAHHLAIGQLRRSKVRQLAAPEIARGDPAPGRTPLDELASERLQRELEAAVAALPDRDREIVLLVGIEGCSPTEAAQILGIKPEAARQRLARARAQLETTVASLRDTPHPARRTA